MSAVLTLLLMSTCDPRKQYCFNFHNIIVYTFEKMGPKMLFLLIFFRSRKWSSFWKNFVVLRTRVTRKVHLHIHHWIIAPLSHPCSGEPQFHSNTYSISRRINFYKPVHSIYLFIVFECYESRWCVLKPSLFLFTRIHIEWCIAYIHIHILDYSLFSRVPVQKGWIRNMKHESIQLYVQQ